MKLCKMRVVLTELEHKQGELVKEETCGALNIYMDPDDYQAFKDGHNGKAIRLTIQEAS